MTIEHLANCIRVVGGNNSVVNSSRAFDCQAGRCVVAALLPRVLYEYDATDIRDSVAVTTVYYFQSDICECVCVGGMRSSWVVVAG